MLSCKCVTNISHSIKQSRTRTNPKEIELCCAFGSGNTEESAAVGNKYADEPSGYPNSKLLETRWLGN